MFLCKKKKSLSNVMCISVHACITFDSTLNNLAVKRNGNITSESDVRIFRKFYTCVNVTF